MDAGGEAEVNDASPDTGDPRSGGYLGHNLLDIMAISICANMAGAENWEEVALWADTKKDLLESRLRLLSGIPPADVIERVFDALDPQQLERDLDSWIEAVGRIMASSGTDPDEESTEAPQNGLTGREALHKINVWTLGNSLLFGQGADRIRPYDTTAIPAILEMLNIRGGLVTISAPGCHSESLARVLDKEGDYLLAVSEYDHDDLQVKLSAKVSASFDQVFKTRTSDVEYDFCESHLEGDGMLQARKCWAIGGPEILRRVDPESQIPGLRTLAMVEGQLHHDGDRHVSSRHYLSSLPNDARTLLDAAWGHWVLGSFAVWSLALMPGPGD